MTDPRIADVIYFIVAILNLALSIFAVYSWIQVILLSNQFKNHVDRKFADRLALTVSVLNLILYLWILVSNLGGLYSVSTLPDDIIFGRVVRTVSLVGWIVISLYHMKVRPGDELK